MSTPAQIVATQNNTTFLNNPAANAKALNDAKQSLFGSRKQAATKGGYAAEGVHCKEGKAALQRAMKELAEKTNGKITFAALEQYQKDLKTAFNSSLRVALKESGVPTEVTFDLAISADGVVSVKCDDAAAKEKIEKFLEKNPKVKEDFAYIQALGNLKRAQSLSPSTLASQLRNSRMELQAEAVSIFFNNMLDNGSMDYAAMIAQFRPNSDASFFTGLNYKV